MADDKSNAGGRDRATVSGAKAYEFEHIAKRHGIKAHGNNREKLDAEAVKLRADRQG